MTRRIPIVRNGTLHEDAEEATSLEAIVVESVAWYAWLERHRSFRFECPASPFTARKEQRPGGWYWYAYRRQAGRLQTAYLGRSAELSVTRLEVIAAALAEGIDTRGGQVLARAQVPALHAPLLQEAGTELRLRHNLPRPLTSLMGREQEVAAAGALLRRPEVRLLSMVGTAGVGKTRLALQVATDLLDDFADGVLFVALAPLRDPDLVLSTVAQALGLRIIGDQSFLDQLKTHLRDKQCLLLLDNFEQVIESAPHLSGLLEACQGVKLLVTSREVLHLRAEHQFSVPPLALPDRKRPPDELALAHVAAVELFLQRAEAIRSDFQMTPGNAAAIAEVCIRLDGLPLAIELAAARIKVFTPHALLARLDRRLQVLTGGARDLPERQRTLRTTIEWSYELLPAEEQRLFRCLAVFVGGCLLEAVEAVSSAAGDSDGNVLEGMASLVDKSLLQPIGRDGEEPRFVMLETIREYGLEALATSGEMEAIRQVHAVYYLRLSQEAEPELDGPQQTVWLERLEREHGNLRAALRWWLERGEAEQGTGDGREMALRLAGALQWFWQVRGHFNEGRTFLEQALTGSKEVASPVRAKTLFAAAQLAHFQGDDGWAEALLEESLTLYRELQDVAGVAFSLHILGRVARTKGNLVAARSLFEEALALWEEVGDKKQIAYSLENLALLESRQGKYTRGRALCEESLAIQRELGNKVGISDVLLQLAWIIFLSQGHLATVRSLVRESLALSREVGDKRGIADCCYLSGHIALGQDDASTARALAEEGLLLYKEVGDRQSIAQMLSLLGRTVAVQDDYTAARALFEESLSVAREIGDKLNSTFYLEGLASVVAVQGESSWAARLWGAAESLRKTMATPIPPVDRLIYERSVAAACAHLGEKAFAAAWAEGSTMAPEQVLAAEGMVSISTAGSSSVTRPQKAPIAPNGLTSRELEVLRLLAQGLTSAQVAERLVIGLVTVNSHVRSIYSKLGVTSRSAATRYAIEHQLV